jgi:hypothetical protein
MMQQKDAPYLGTHGTKRQSPATLTWLVFLERTQSSSNGYLFNNGSLAVVPETADLRRAGS